MATHLLNILPSSSINNDTPYHKLFNKKPSYSHLCVFGCLCYSHIPTFPKLSPKSIPCFFLGYHTQHRRVRCLNLKKNQIILSRHVAFDEFVFPFGSMTPSYDFLNHSNIIYLTLCQTPVSSPISPSADSSSSMTTSHSQNNPPVDSTSTNNSFPHLPPDL